MGRIDITTREELQKLAKIFAKHLSITEKEAFNILVEVGKFTICIELREGTEVP